MTSPGAYIAHVGRWGKQTKRAPVDVRGVGDRGRRELRIALLTPQSGLARRVPDPGTNR